MPVGSVEAGRDLGEANQPPLLIWSKVFDEKGMDDLTEEMLVDSPRAAADVALDDVTVDDRRVTRHGYGTFPCWRPRLGSENVWAMLSSGLRGVLRSPRRPLPRRWPGSATGCAARGSSVSPFGEQIVRRWRRALLVRSALSHEGRDGALADDGDAVLAGLACLAGEAVEIRRDQQGRAFRNGGFHDESCLVQALLQPVSRLIHHAGQDDYVATRESGTARGVTLPSIGGWPFKKRVIHRLGW